MLSGTLRGLKPAASAECLASGGSRSTGCAPPPFESCGFPTVCGNQQEPRRHSLALANCCRAPAEREARTTTLQTKRDNGPAEDRTPSLHRSETACGVSDTFPLTEEAIRPQKDFVRVTSYHWRLCRRVLLPAKAFDYGPAHVLLP
jgi:hypothetical protein